MRTNDQKKASAKRAEAFPLLTEFEVSDEASVVILIIIVIVWQRSRFAHRKRVPVGA
jgi:hypothetical protein